jgi:hypothetical protein
MNDETNKRNKMEKKEMAGFFEVYLTFFNKVELTLEEYKLLHECYKMECDQLKFENMLYIQAEVWSGVMSELLEETRKTKRQQHFFNISKNL